MGVMITALMLYLAAAIGRVLYLRKAIYSYHNSLDGFVAIAVILHGWLLYQWIDTHTGQRLSSANLFSFITWLMAILLLLLNRVKPVANVGIFLYPCAALSLLLAFHAPGMAHKPIWVTPAQLTHILLSSLVVSILCLGGLQGILLAWQEWLLKHKPAAAVQLPSLEAMEALLFQIILLGFILLSILLLTSLWEFYSLLTPQLVQKVIVSSIAWLSFAILLWGRHCFGWRSSKALRWILFGIILMVLIYFSSQFYLSLWI